MIPLGGGGGEERLAIAAALQEALEAKLEAYKAEVRAKERVAQERWSIKRDACLAALDVVDRAMTNMKWTMPGSGSQVPVVAEEVSAADARAAMNRLAMTCDNPEVVRLFLRCLNVRNADDATPPLAADAIHDLRNAIRKELEFGTNLDIDRSAAWIAVLPKKTS